MKTEKNQKTSSGIKQEQFRYAPALKIALPLILLAVVVLIMVRIGALESMPGMWNDINGHEETIRQTDAQEMAEQEETVQVNEGLPDERMTEDDLTETEKKNASFLKAYSERKRRLHGKVAGNEALVDLDGDGREDRVRLDCQPGSDTFTLYVNETSITGEGSNLDGCMFISDIDEKDGIREIGIPESGPSSDEKMAFYYYDGDRIRFVGKVQGRQYSIGIDGSGRLTASTRGQILHTWFYDDYYKLSEQHTLVNLPQDLYAMNCPVRVIKPLALQKSREDASFAFTLKEGEQAVILASDNSEWCLVENAKGDRGWFAIDGFNEVRGTGLSASSFFEGLCYAD